MSGLLKYSDKGFAPESMSGPEFPAAGPETVVDPYDTGRGGGGQPAVDIGRDPFAGSVAGSIPGVTTGGGDPFAGSTAGSIPGVIAAGAGPVAGGFPFGIGGGAPYRAPGLADFLGRPRAPVRTAVPPPVIGPPAAWTGAGPVLPPRPPRAQNPYWIANLAQMMGRGRLGAYQ